MGSGGGANLTLMNTPACTDAGTTNAAIANSKKQADRKNRMVEPPRSIGPAPPVVRMSLPAGQNPWHHPARVAGRSSFNLVKLEQKILPLHAICGCGSGANADAQAE